MIFGVDLNVWLVPFQKALVNEWMMAGYFSYYLLVPLVGFPLLLRGRISELNAFLTAATITFVISYFGFVFYPIEGPRFFLADQLSQPLSGYLFVPLVRWIIANGAIHGGCMPSSHVAVAWVALFWAYRTQRRLAIVLTPLVATLFFATIWGRFHYISDVAVGWPIGILGIWIGGRLTRSRTRRDSAPQLERHANRDLVAKTMGGTK
jgi:membrane-associated phospholipid phosphatase